MKPPPITTVTPAQILRNGYKQAALHDAPADMRERLFAAAAEAERPASRDYADREQISDIVAVCEKMKEKSK